MTVKIESEGFNFDACLQQLGAQRIGTLNANLEITLVMDFRTRKPTGEVIVRCTGGMPDRQFQNHADAVDYIGAQMAALAAWKAE